jgi:hypothetical protein
MIWRLYWFVLYRTIGEGPMKPHVLVLAVPFAALLLVSTAFAQPHAWSFERVDSTSNGGAYSSLALDMQANPRIAYRAFGSDLKYASKSLGSWTFEYPSFGSPQDISLELDANGEPRVSFFSNSDGTLQYGERNSGTWSFTTVDAAPFSAGLYSSLRLDAQGNPRIAYHNEGSGFVLRFAERNAGVWTTETPDAVGATGYQASLALDKNGNPRISYYSITAGTLKYAAKDGGLWTTEAVDATGPPDLNTSYPHTSIALDSLGNPHIGYYDNAHGKLRYATKSGGVWARTTVDSAGNVGGYVSLRLDNLDRPRLAYYDISNGDLKFAHETGGAWTVERVDAIGDVGRWCSLRIDPQGDPYISYLDASRSSLKLVHGPLGVLSVGPAAGPGLDLASISNPVGGDLRVRFALPSGEPASLELIDVSGRLLTSREVGTLGAGRHQLSLGACTPGLYFVRLTQESARMTRKVIVVR